MQPQHKHAYDCAFEAIKVDGDPLCVWGRTEHTQGDFSDRLFDLDERMHDRRRQESHAQRQRNIRRKRRQGGR